MSKKKEDLSKKCPVKLSQEHKNLLWSRFCESFDEKTSLKDKKLVLLFCYADIYFDSGLETFKIDNESELKLELMSKLGVLGEGLVNSLRLFWAACNRNNEKFGSCEFESANVILPIDDCEIPTLKLSSAYRPAFSSPFAGNIREIIDIFCRELLSISLLKMACSLKKGVDVEVLPIEERLASRYSFFGDGKDFFVSDLSNVRISSTAIKEVERYQENFDSFKKRCNGSLSYLKGQFQGSGVYFLPFMCNGVANLNLFKVGGKELVILLANSNLGEGKYPICVVDDKVQGGNKMLICDRPYYEKFAKEWVTSNMSKSFLCLRTNSSDANLDDVCVAIADFLIVNSDEVGPQYIKALQEYFGQENVLCLNFAQSKIVMPNIIRISPVDLMLPKSELLNDFYIQLQDRGFDLCLNSTKQGAFLGQDFGLRRIICPGMSNFLPKKKPLELDVENIASRKRSGAFIDSGNRDEPSDLTSEEYPSGLRYDNRMTDELALKVVKKINESVNKGGCSPRPSSASVIKDKRDKRRPTEPALKKGASGTGFASLDDGERLTANLAALKPEGGALKDAPATGPANPVAHAGATSRVVTHL